MTILDVMAEAIDAPEEMSVHAPRIITVKIPVDKIGEVIGPKGKIINQIQDDTGATLSIEDDGTIYIGATNGEAAEAATAAVNAIANPTMPEVGERYLGTVVKTTNFGAFVSLMPGKDGLLHISKLRALAGGKRVDTVEDVVSVGQKVQVEIAEIDDRGKLSLIPVVEDAAAGDEAEASDDDRVTTAPHGRPAGRSTGRQRRRTLLAGCPLPSRPARPAPLETVRDSDGQVTSRVRRTVLPGGLRVVTEQHGRRPLGQHRRLGRRRLARRDAGPARLLALPRAPAVQGHPRAVRAWTSRSRSTRSAASSTPSPPRSTPASTRGCSTTTCRWRSTCSATWSPTR